MRTLVALTFFFSSAISSAFIFGPEKPTKCGTIVGKNVDFFVFGNKIEIAGKTIKCKQPRITKRTSKKANAVVRCGKYTITIRTEADSVGDSHSIVKCVTKLTQVSLNSPAARATSRVQYQFHQSGVY